MMRTLAIVACALLLAACGPREPQQAGAPASTLASGPAAAASAAPATLARYDGYGDLRLGMDPVAFAKAWQGPLKPRGAGGPTGCFYMTPEGLQAPPDVAFMFDDGRFVRYDVATVKETAPGGGKVGMAAARVHALYGKRVSELPHKYVPGAKVLRVNAPHGKGALVFETDASGTVTHWRAGVPPQVDYMEGCG